MEGGAWEIQFIHHKLYLTNGLPEIQHFEITHGFNTLTFGRAWTTLPVTIRLGGGLVIAHPESEIRRMSLSPGYQLTGPAVFAGVRKRFPLGRRAFLAAEAQFPVARAHVPVRGGEASAPNVFPSRVVRTRISFLRLRKGDPDPTGLRGDQGCEWEEEYNASSNQARLDYVTLFEAGLQHEELKKRTSPQCHEPGRDDSAGAGHEGGLVR